MRCEAANGESPLAEGHIDGGLCKEALPAVVFRGGRRGRPVLEVSLK